MTTHAMFRTSIIRPAHNVRLMAPVQREPTLPKARTCAATVTLSRAAVDRSPDQLLQSLEKFGNGRVPTLNDLDNLPDSHVCEVLGIMGAVHRRRQAGSSPVMLGCYQALTKPLVDTLPAHCSHLNNNNLILLVIALSDLCSDSRAPRGSSLLSSAQAVSASAADQLLDFVLPELLNRLTYSTVTLKQATKLTRALSDLPTSVTCYPAFSEICIALAPSIAAHIHAIDAPTGMTLLVCASSQHALIPENPQVLAAQLQAIGKMDTTNYPPNMNHRAILNTLWAVRCLKKQNPEVLRMAMTRVDAARFRGSLSTLLMRSFRDKRQRWDVNMVQKAAMGAAILHMRDAAFVQQLFMKAIPYEDTELTGRRALAFLDLVCGAQRHTRNAYKPTDIERRAICIGILQAGTKRERRWTAFECWQICRMLPHLDRQVSSHQFTRVVQHTVWNEHTQLGQGSYRWEVVFSDVTLFTSRMHALLNAAVPHGVLYAFCRATSELDGFYNDIKPRDTLTMLRVLIPTTGLDHITQVLFDAAAKHAENGHNMSYAIYVAAKLRRPEDVCRLWAALQPCVSGMSSRDVFNVLWACARSRLGEKLDLMPALVRLEHLLLENLGSTVATDATLKEDVFDDEKREEKSDVQFTDSHMPGWLVAQIAWSIAEMKLPVKPEVAANLFQTIRGDTVLNATDYTNLLWAASKLPVDLQGSVLWAKVRQVWSNSLRGWRSKELCTILWSLGALKLNPGHETVSALLGRISPHAEVLPVKHTLIAITGASFLHYKPEEHLLQCVEAKLAQNILTVNPEELSRCLFTFTRLAYKPSKLLDSIDSCLPHSAHVLGDVHCAVKVSLCIAAFDMDLPRLHAWTMKVLSQMQASQFPTSELVDQAVTAHKIGKHRGLEACELPEFMIETYDAAQEARFHCHRHRPCLDSICSQLKEMQLGPVNREKLVPGGSVYVDVLLPSVTHEGKPVAIIILGEQDIAVNMGTPLGHTILRRKLIECYGLHVLSITEEAWNARTAPNDFMLSLLQDCSSV